MKLNIREESFHYLRKENKTESDFKLKAGIFFRQRILRKFELPYLELFITTRCNLKCKHCSNLIPSLESKCNFDAAGVIRTVDLLLSKIDCLYRLKIHGGEVFLHPQLREIIDYLKTEKKIKSIRLTTNGTVIPSDEVLKSIANGNIVVQISDYDLGNSKVVQLIDKLKSFGIAYAYLKEQAWSDMGEFEARENSRFDDCTVKRCTSVFEGKLYVCSRAAIMAKQGIIVDEGIPLSLDGRELRKSIKNLYNGKSSIACRHCDGDTRFARVIKAGEQTE